MEIERHLDELEAQGYTVIADFLDAARARAACAPSSRRICDTMRAQQLRGLPHRARLHAGRPRPLLRGHRRRRARAGAARPPAAAGLPADREPGDLHPPGRDAAADPLRRLVLSGAAAAAVDQLQHDRRGRCLQRRERRHRSHPGQPSLERRADRRRLRRPRCRCGDAGRARAPAACRWRAGRRLHLLPRHPDASRRRQSQRRAAAGLLEPVLRAVGADAGELLPRPAAGARARHVAAPADAARLRDHAAVHGPCDRVASGQGAAAGVRQRRRRRAHRSDTEGDPMAFAHLLDRFIGDAWPSLGDRRRPPRLRSDAVCRSHRRAEHLRGAAARRGARSRCRAIAVPAECRPRRHAGAGLAIAISSAA